MRVALICFLALTACSKEEQDRAREDYLSNCQFEKVELRDWPTRGQVMTTFYICHHAVRECHVFVSTDKTLVASDCSNY